VDARAVAPHLGCRLVRGIWVWVCFRLPEPKDRTYAELDMLFEQGVSARKFAKTDPYSSEAWSEKRLSTATAEEKRSVE